ncbi:MAG TPA: phage major capsid protein, partial [Sphingomicrobium sp.]
VAYEAARPSTNTPTFSEIVPAAGELYANPAASQQMLDDAMFDVEAWLAQEIATEFARAEGLAFVKGNGTNQPLGFTSSPNATTADGVRPMGTLQTIGTGVAGAFPASNPADKLIDLVQTLRSPYRQGAVFVMNSTVAAAIRKFKTSDGAFLFQPSLAAGQPATLLGYPLIEAEDMPDMANNSLSIAFGNFKAGYVIAERNATTILRDPFTNKPYVHFYATLDHGDFGRRCAADHRRHPDRCDRRGGPCGPGRYGRRLCRPRGEQASGDRTAGRASSNRVAAGAGPDRDRVADLVRHCGR